MQTAKQLIFFILLTTGLFYRLSGQTKTDLYRPLYHFTPDSNWINDPNGLVYANGEYHLLYQYNPYSNLWGHMSWGHAVSQDLLHWKSRPVAMHEYKNRKTDDSVMIFSGSVVVDKDNSSGFGTNGHHPPMVAIYTSMEHANLHSKVQHQSIAFSNDNGLTWTQYENNPVLDMHSLEFRDPKVFWYAPQRKWVMVVSKPDRQQVYLYTSKNLKEWQFLSRWGRAGNTAMYWECPDLFELPVIGSTHKKWVLTVSAGSPQETYGGMQYFIGDFDGKTFTPDHNYDEPAYLDFGKDYYAGVSYNNNPGNRRIMVGWLNNWAYANAIPTGPVWRGAFAIPRELGLKKYGDGYQLIQQPVRELDALKQESFSLPQQVVDSTFDLPFKGTSYELDITLEPGTADRAGVRVLKSDGEATVITYDKGEKSVMLDRINSGNVAFTKRFPSIERTKGLLRNGPLTLKILVDKCVVEVFVNDGEITLTDLVFPLKEDGAMQLFSSGGRTNFTGIRVWKLHSVK